MSSPRFITDPERTSFLTASDVPANLLRLKVGDVLRWVGEARTVERVGYRKTAADYLDEAMRRLKEDPNGRRAALLLRALIFGSASTFDPAPRELDWYLARRLASADRLGGPDRGILMNTTPYALDYSATPVVVLGTRTVRLGRYFPPIGGGEDYEDGGLANVRSVVLVQSGIGEVISGDLVRA